MSKLHCRCGNIINLSTIPSPNEKYLIDSRDFYSVIESLDSQAYKQAVQMLEEKTLSVVTCDNCGRYYVSKGEDSYHKYQAFVPENT
jgi:hypothetical protein